MSFRTREEYEEAKRTWYPAPHMAYIQETGDWISFIGSDDLIFEDEELTKIMGNVKLRDVNKLQQLGNRFRKSDISTFNEFRYFSCILKLEDNAFEGCANLQHIVLPEYLYIIGHHAFSHCVGLEKLDLPPTVEIIGDSAFSGCSSLKSITIPYQVKSIGTYAFSKCTALEEIDIKTYMPPYIHDATIIEGCSSLRSINMYPSVVEKCKADHTWQKLSHLLKPKEWIR